MSIPFSNTGRRGNNKKKKKNEKKTAMELSSFLGRIVPKKQTSFFTSEYWLEKKPLRMQKSPEFKPHEIPVVYKKKEQVLEDGLPLPPPQFSQDRKWNTEYQNLIDVLYLKDDGDHPDTERIVTYRLELLALQNDFTTLVQYVARKIVLELTLPANKKTIRPIRWAEYYPEPYLSPRQGKFLRFKEFIHRGVVYRISLADSANGGPFAHEHECAKMIGVQLKGVREFAIAALGTEFHVGLSTVVDFGGYRIRARALMPLGEDDIIRQLGEPLMEKPPLKDRRFEMVDDVAVELEKALHEEHRHTTPVKQQPGRRTGTTFLTDDVQGVNGGHPSTPGSPLPESILARVLVVNDSPGLSYDDTVATADTTIGSPLPPLSPRVRYTASEHLDLAATDRNENPPDRAFDELELRHERQLMGVASKLNLKYEGKDHDHGNAWRAIVRKGRDGRLYIIEPYLLFPREPDNDDDPAANAGEGFMSYLRPEHIRSPSIQPLMNDLYCNRQECIDAVDDAMLKLYGENGTLSDLHRVIVSFYVDDPDWWSLAADASNLTDLIHHHGLHLDTLGEIRRLLSVQHGELLQDGADENRLYLQGRLNEAVLGEIGIRSIKGICAARLRQGKPKTMDEMKAIVSTYLNAALSQSPGASEFWRTEVGQVANSKFGLSVSLDEETGVQHIKRACNLNSVEFYTRFETLAGVCLNEARIAEALEDPVHFFSVLEPFRVSDVDDLDAKVKGDTIPLHAPALIALQAEVCQDDDEKHMYLDWALEEFVRYHVQHPFSVENLNEWGRALCAKGILVAKGVESVTIENWADLSDEERLKKVIDSEGFFAKSIEVFSHVSRIAPKNIDALCGLGAVKAHCAYVAREAEFFRDGRKLAREAEGIFEKALELEPDSVRLKTNLGKILVFEATCFAEMADKKAGASLGIEKIDLFKKYPIFGKALHVMKQLQQVTKIEKGLAILQDCLRSDPTHKFAKQVYDEGCVVYARIFLEPHDHFVVN